MRRLAGWVRVGAAVVSVAALVVVDAGAADAGAWSRLTVPEAPPAAVSVVPVVSAPDVVSARVAARAQGLRVEVVGERDEFTSTFVNPDGTLTTETSSAPMWFKDASAAPDQGGWRRVDLDLVERAGQVVPAASDLGVTLSAGGPAGAEFVSVDHSVKDAKTGKRTGRSVSWALGGHGKNAKLPAPKLSGRDATYENVLAGVDLRVQVRPSGFEQDFILKDRASADALVAAGGSFQIPLKTKGLTARATADGGVEFVDAKGVVVSTVPAAFAWDAQVDPRSGEPASKVPVALSVAQSNQGNAVLSVTPDAGWLADPGRVFPVTIDPTYATKAVAPSFDTWVATNYPNNDKSSDPELKVGTYDGGVTKARSFITFPIGPYRGYDIVSANLSLFESWSFSCTARSVSAWWASPADTSTRWGNQPWFSASVSGSVSTAKGFSSSCPAGRISIPITTIVRDHWAGTTYDTGSLALTASESDSYGWKKFHSKEGANPPSLSITYNRAPNTAGVPTLGSPAVAFTPVGGTTSTVYTSDLTPLFQSAATDPDASSVKLTFEVHSSQTTSTSTLKASCTTGLVGSGATGSCSPATALGDNGTYYVRARASDERGLVASAWSGWRTFRVAAATPAAPVISCPVPYNVNNAWVDASPSANVACTISAAGTGTNAPAFISYKVDGAAMWSMVPITQSGDAGVAKVSVSIPKTNGAHSIFATAKSPSGKVSAEKRFYIGWGNASLSTPRKSPRSTSTGALAITVAGPPLGTATAVSAQVKWRTAGSGTSEADAYWNRASTAVLAKSKDDPTGVVFTGSWNTMDAVTDTTIGQNLNPRVPVQLDVQVCLTYTGATTQQQCTWSDAGSKATITRLPHAFGNGFPTADAGPGQVALFTGEFTTSVTDVQVPGYAGSLSLSRSHSTYGNGADAAIPPAQQVFGPGWTAALDGSDAGLAGLTVYDNTHLDGSLVFADEDGSAMIFAPDDAKPRRTGASLTPTSTTAWVAVDEQALEAGLGLTVSGTGTGTTLKLVEEDGTVTTFTAAGGAPATGKAGVFRPTGVHVPGVGATSYDYGSGATAGLVERILAPTPTGLGAASCPKGAEVTGCRALAISYGTSTATTGVGDVDRQVDRVELKIYNPDAGLSVTSCAGVRSTVGVGMVSVPVACYLYDRGSKRLATVYDPRTQVAADKPMFGTSYTYGANNRLASVAPVAVTYTTDGVLASRMNTQDATVLNYTSLEARDKLTSVTRTAPTTVVGGGAGTARNLTRITYAAPLSGTGLPNLSTAGVARWGQQPGPTYAAAVFGPDYTGPVPTSGTGTGVDWTYADFSYTDAAGYTLNTAGYGAGQWLYTHTGYDEAGRVVFTLDAPAIADLIATTSGDVDNTAWGTSTVYNIDTTAMATPPDGVPANTAAGSVVTDTWAPARWVVLPDGNTALVRPHTHTDYDQGAPDHPAPAAGQPDPPPGVDPATGLGYALPTTVTVTADPSAYGKATSTGPAVSRTFTGYLDQTGSATSSTSGWTLRAPTSSTIDMNLADHPGAATGGRPVPMPVDLTTRTFYDAAGRTVETRQPASTGSDAGTTRTVYYTVGANPQAPACGSKPAWAGLTCTTGPAAAPTVPTGATPATGAATLPTSHITGYSYLLAPTSTLETSGGVTRTSTTGYDPAGRTRSTGTSVAGLTGPAGTATAASTPLASTSHSYDPATGLPDTVTRTDRAGAVTASSSSTYDTWARVTSTSTTGPSGTTVRTEYDAAGRAVAVTDPKSVTRYSYDGPVVIDDAGTTATERRGLVTKVTVTRTGLAETPGNLLTYTGTYDRAGHLTRQSLPGGLVQYARYDLAGQQTELSYHGQVTSYTTSTDPDTGETIYAPGQTKLGPWIAWTMAQDTQGRIVRQHNGLEAGSMAAFEGMPGTDPTDPGAPSLGPAFAADLTYHYDQAGRLIQATDRTSTQAGTVPAPGDEPTAGIACTVRTYTFDANGNRTSLTQAAHPDSDCAATPTPDTRTGYDYDSADRPTTAGHHRDTTGTPGTYTYDALGRQTRLPAADAPNPDNGDIVLSYHDNDLPATITQGTGTSRTSTSYTLDVADRRAVATTTRGDGTSTVTTRVYTDDSDNPAWTTTTHTPAPDGTGPTGTSTTRHTPGLSGDLAAQINDADGAATISLANPHGDAVTTITIPAGTTEATPAVAINGWAAYTEYGQPTPATTPDARAGISGVNGYGWLGTKERSTTPESAGLTLMGVRLYNPTRGQFTSLDPVPGGNTTAYTYPQDPINAFDLDGRWPSWLNWKNAARVATAVGFGVCVAASAGWCAVAGLAGAVVSARADAGRWSGRTFRSSLFRNGAFALLGAGMGKALQKAYQVGGGASYTSTRLSIGYGKRANGSYGVGYRIRPKWNYRPSYYVHSAKMGFVAGAYQNRRNW